MDRFARNHTQWDGRQSVCRDCTRIYRVLARAIRQGVVTRPDHCAHCQRRVKLIAHHADYSKPLDVLWLCHRCHKAVHRL